MGRMLQRTTQLLGAGQEPLAQHAAVEWYLYNKIDAKLSVEENRVRLHDKADRLERSVAYPVQAIIRHELHRFDCNLPQALGRKAAGTTGLDAARRINEATHIRQIEAITRSYLAAKVTSRTSEADNLACLSNKTLGLLAHVAVSCAPHVQRAAEACMQDVGLLRLRHAEYLRRSRRNNTSSFGSGGGGSGGGGM